MANEYDTPAEREAKANETHARINEAIAQDVAMGMAEKADAEEARARALANSNWRLNRERENADFQRFHAEQAEADARRSANGSKFGIWLLASVLAATLFFGSLLWANRANDATGNASSASMPPTVVTRTVVASPSPAPAAPPTVINNYVPVPVHTAPIRTVPATQAVPDPQPLHGYTKMAPRMETVTPAPKATVAPTVEPNIQPESTDSDKPLNGYVQP